MTCRSCGNDKATVIRTIYHEGGLIDYCRGCDASISVAMSIPDVYLQRSGQTFENLTDTMGHPIPIMSKRHKKQVMDKLGVSEAGDRVHGAYQTPKTWTESTREYRAKNFEKDRPNIRKVAPLIRELARKELNARRK